MEGNLQALHRPFDIIGDVHGCYDELAELLGRLGYRVDGSGDEISVQPPDGRTLVFVGDLVDRGPKIVQALRLAMALVAAGQALAVPGNHDDKLMRALMGRKVQVKNGLEQSLAQLADEPAEFREAVKRFFQRLPSHYVLDEGRLVVAHAGIREYMIGQSSERIRDFTLYGETTGKTDEYGLPVRGNWMKRYHGNALIVYGHTPVAEPLRINNMLNIDTGCVFGGKLTALRYPELELVSVPAREIYAVSARPFLTGAGERASGGT